MKYGANLSLQQLGYDHQGVSISGTERFVGFGGIIYLACVYITMWRLNDTHSSA